MDEIIEKAKISSSIGTEKTWESKVYIKAGIGWTCCTVHFIYIGVHCGVMLSLFYKRLCNKYLDSQRWLNIFVLYKV